MEDSRFLANVPQAATVSQELADIRAAAFYPQTSLQAVIDAKTPHDKDSAALTFLQHIEGEWQLSQQFARTKQDFMKGTISAIREAIPTRLQRELQMRVMWNEEGTRAYLAIPTAKFNAAAQERNFKGSLNGIKPQDSVRHALG